MNTKQVFLLEAYNYFTSTPMPGLNEANRKRFNSLAGYLLKPNINPRDLGLTYATIKYWESKGYLLFPTLKETDEWRKYSVIEYLWFELLKRVIEMGCNLDKLAPKLIFAYTNYKGPKSFIGYTEEQVPVILINEVRANTVFNFLNHTILTVLLRSRSSVYITDDGCNFLFKGGDRGASANEAYNKIFNSGINISISDIVIPCILGMNQVYFNDLKLFTDEEIKVISKLSNNTISQITIKQEDGKIYEMHVGEKFTVKDARKYLAQFITSNYQELNFKTNNNQSISICRTTKEKFKN